jgi:LPXTG-site transpeptidase (sortase) family protein
VGLLTLGVLAVGLGVLLAGRTAALGVGLPLGGRVSGVAAARPTPSTPAAPTPGQSDLLAKARAIMAPAALPARLAVPVIGVDAAVESVGLDAQGRMATPSRAENVAWYNLGATPGDAGNAVIAGHLDWTSGPAVFWKLAKLKKGDELSIMRVDGTRARFLVDSSATMPYDAATEGLFTKTGPPTLTLITCAGAWDRARATYLQRLVVRASLAPSPPTYSPGDEGG